MTTHTIVGAVFRSAAGLGVEAVLATPRCADPLHRHSVRVSTGTAFQVPWTRTEPWPAGIDQLEDAGFHVAALALTDDSVALQDFAAQRPDRLALLLGTDAARPDVTASAQASVKPSPGAADGEGCAQRL